ncbi:MAG: class I SAM-dependent methyltransferase [Microbacterium sp.]
MDDVDTEATDRFAGELFTKFVGAMEILSVYVGDRLGLYRALAGGPATADELAAATGMNPRYAREWLEQQAVAGILGAEDGDRPPASRRFTLPAAHAEVLTNRTSLAYSAPMPRMLAAAASRLPELLEGYRSGGGVGWAAFGEDARDGQGDINRPWFESRLAGALASVPAIEELLSRPGARIADVGSGHGWSTIALARAYPAAEVDGFDVDGPSVVAAREHATGVPNVSFTLLGGEQLAEGRDGSYAAAFVFEALHDMPDPVSVLAALRRAVHPDGVVVVMDEAVADAFAPDGDEVERVMYGYSLFICLPDSMSAADSVATGTVMRRSTLEGYAREAGFSGVSVLPIDDFAAFRFYALER